MTWDEIRGDRRFRNRWVALDHCTYAETGMEPVKAEVVDADADLSELCARLTDTDRSRCSIVFCAEAELSPVRLPERRRFLRAS